MIREPAPRVPTSQVLEQLLKGASPGHVTLAWLLGSLRERSFGILLLLIGLVGLLPGASILSGLFLGEQSFRYLLGRRAVVPYRLAFLGFIFIGPIGGLVTVWDFADTLNGLMAAPNLIALVALAGVVVREKTALLAARD